METANMEMSLLYQKGNPNPDPPPDLDLTSAITESFSFGPPYLCECGKTFEVLRKFKMHRRHHQLTYPCPDPTCDKLFAFKNAMNRHYDSYHNPNRVLFQCQKCEKSFTSQKYLRIHDLIHQGVRPWSCNQCPKSFYERNKLLQHQRDHNPQNLACEVCGKNFVRYASLRQHRQLNHFAPKIYKCEAEGCDYQCRTKLSRDHHNNVVHGSNSKPWICEQCGKGFHLKTGMLQHQLRVHNIQPPSNIRTYCCHVCSKIYFREKELTDHIAAFHDGEKLKCPVCGELFRSRGGLAHHKLQMHSEKRFKCERCDRAFPRACLLARHARVHTGERSFAFACPEEGCGRKFRLQALLQMHQRVHTGEKAYRCTVEGCDKSFVNSTSLKKHTYTHTGEKPFQCSECPQAYAFPNELKLHSRIHTGEKPYQCQQCGRPFRIKSQLTCHTRNMKGKCRPYRPSSKTEREGRRKARRKERKSSDNQPVSRPRRESQKTTPKTPVTSSSSSSEEEGSASESSSSSWSSRPKKSHVRQRVRLKPKARRRPGTKFQATNRVVPTRSLPIRQKRKSQETDRKTINTTGLTPDDLVELPYLYPSCQLVKEEPNSPRPWDNQDDAQCPWPLALDETEPLEFLEDIKPFLPGELPEIHGIFQTTTQSTGCDSESVPVKEKRNFARFKRKPPIPKMVIKKVLDSTNGEEESIKIKEEPGDNEAEPETHEVRKTQRRRGPGRPRKRKPIVDSDSEDSNSEGGTQSSSVIQRDKRISQGLKATTSSNEEGDGEEFDEEYKPPSRSRSARTRRGTAARSRAQKPRISTDTDGSTKRPRGRPKNPNGPIPRKNLPRRFQCELCPKKYACNRDLQEHKTSHSNLRPYQCADCGRTYKTKNSLTEHSRIHNPEKVVVCPLCQRPFQRQVYLTAHMEIHKGDKKVPMYNSAATVNAHFPKTANTENVSSVGSESGTSSCSFDQPSSQSQPQPQSSLNTDLIINTGLTFENMQQHQQSLHFGFTVDITNNPPSLVINDAALLKRNFAEIQLPVPTEPQPQQRPEKSAAAPIQLEDFEYDANGQPLPKKPRFPGGVKCPHCGIVYKTRSRLLHHLPSHTHEKPYLCEICSKTFKSFGSLREHKQIHVKPEICPRPNCGKSFASKHNLRHHMNLHARKDEQAHLETHKPSEPSEHEPLITKSEDQLIMDNELLPSFDTLPGNNLHVSMDSMSSGAPTEILQVCSDDITGFNLI